jgi:TPR repeat protein
MNCYAECLKMGRGIEQDIWSVAHCLKLAADLVECQSMYDYAWCFASGSGPEQDAGSADRDFRMAADSDDSSVLWSVATRWMEGDGLATVEEGARRYFTRLESISDVEGFRNMARILRTGLGDRMEIAESLC